MNRLKLLAMGALALALALGLTQLALSKPLPSGEGGPAADALAHRIEAAVNVHAWRQTGAVAWTFGGRNHHLWDVQRHLARVKWGENTVLVDLSKVDGRAWVNGEEAQGDKRLKLVKKAHAAWINDSFWLNPLAKLFDEGVSRSVVEWVEDGETRPALLIDYSSGGLTPGDAYLWILSDGGRPQAWRMWVSIIPLKGLKASWDGWMQIDTGAWIATEHTMGPITLELTNVRGKKNLAELEPGPDPFAALMGADPAQP